MLTLRLIPETGPPLAITKDHVILGRDPACDVVVDSRKVSRRHAAVERRGEAWFVVDKDSANGVFVEGCKVAEARLEDGQELRLGAVAFEVQIDADFDETELISPAEVMEKTVQMLDPAGPRRERRPPPAPVVPSPPPLAQKPEPPRAPPATPLVAAVSSADEAAALLGVPRGATPDEVRGRYLELTQDLQTKLAHTKNPSLKASYQKTLDSLRRSLVVLVPGSTGEIAAADLPAVQPVASPDDLIEAVARKGSVEAPPAAAPAKGAGELLRPATGILILAATVLIAVATFFALSTGKNAKEIKTLKNASELASAREAAMKYVAGRTLLEGGVLKNGRLKLCNRASVPLEVAWLAAVYLTREDLPPSADRTLADKASGFKVETYNSAYCAKEFKLVLPPFSEQEVRLTSDIARCSWDGSALFFGLALQGPQAPATVEGRPEGADPATADSKTVWSGGLPPPEPECVSVGQGW